MSYIKIKNFGPIKNGYGDQFFEIRKVTLFTGNQGSGKSTISKLISTLSWLEKAIVRGHLKKDKINTRDKFIKYCEYQNLTEYFNKDNACEIIEYKSKYLLFSLKDGKVDIQVEEVLDFFLPKIMYIPSERNLLSTVRNISNVKGLPSTLYTFSDEFFKALNSLKFKLDLPINNAKFEYQKLNDISYVIGEDYKIRLSNSSSGFQSFIPLYVVSKFIAESIIKKKDSPYTTATVENSIKENERLGKEIDSILNNKNLSSKLKMVYLEQLSKKEDYSSFLNIVEEPEQNLFPSSQKDILYSLLSFNNLAKSNKLILTTHSPYLLNYLTLSIKANSLYSLVSEELKEKIEGIVPKESFVKKEDVIIYELDEITGSIRILDDYNGIPSDENLLNNKLDEFNSLYAHLLDIQNKAKK